MTYAAREPEEKNALALAEAIFEIGRLAAQSHDLNGVVRQINKRIMAETRADFVGIGLLSCDGRHVEHAWGSLSDGTDMKGPHPQTLGEGVVGRAAAERRVVRVDVLKEESTYLEMVPGMGSKVAVPLILGDRVVGVIDVESRKPRAFGDRDVALLQAVANPIAQAVELAHVLQENHRRQERLELLNELARAAATTPELDTLLPAVTRIIRERLELPFVAIGLLNDDGRVELRALATDRDVKLPVGHTQALGEGVTGQVLQSGESVLVPDVTARDNHVPVHPDFRAELCCPMRIGTRAIGFLDVEHERVGAFGEPDRLLVQTIAEQLAQVVDNASNIRRIERLRDELSGMFVHDLRNPLSVVQSTLDMLVREFGPSPAPRPSPKEPDKPPRHRRWLRAAQGSVNEMLVMIDGLLNLQRLESRALQVNRRECDLPQLMETVIEQLRVISGPAHVEVEAEIALPLPAARLDESLVQRILQNIGVNAVKFTGSGGRVTVLAGEAPADLVGQRLQCDTPCVLLTVQDTGPGIPASEHERIFDKFAVLESRRAGHKFSTGLGLAFCRKAAEAHGGTIWVESEIGKGSSFHVLLPLDDV